jgi:poly-gamma-glutamate synthesis protein (capsule biosynthesis protein)
MGELGCNLANLASNHSFDFTQQNITNSVSAWQKVPNMLAFAGENQNQAQHDAVRYFTMDGIKFAFMAYTTYINTDAPVQNSYGVNVFSNAFAAKQISEAKANGAKFIIVSMRWGTEYATTVNATEAQDAQFLADQGVNLILGHGTHELQPVSWLTGKNGNKTLVWFGLGDFLQSQIPAQTVFRGFPIMDMNTITLKVRNLAFLPIFMHYDWSAQQAAAQDLSARTNLHLYLLEDVTQKMINDQQLNTTVAAQKQRMENTLTSYGVNVPLIDSQQYLSTH